MGALSAMYSDESAKALAVAKGSTNPTTDKDKEKKRAIWTFIACFALAGTGYGAAIVISALWEEPPPPTLTEGLNAFTLLFMLALAIERLLQPIAPVLGPDSAEAKAELAQATAGSQQEQQAQAKVGDARGKTALVTWGAATGLAALAAVGLNITILGSVLTSESSRPPYWIDLLITALAVGAGTKPLNDLWTRLQNKSS